MSQFFLARRANNDAVSCPPPFEACLIKRTMMQRLASQGANARWGPWYLITEQTRKVSVFVDPENPTWPETKNASIIPRTPTGPKAEGGAPQLLARSPLAFKPRRTALQREIRPRATGRCGVCQKGSALHLPHSTFGNLPYTPAPRERPQKPGDWDHAQTRDWGETPSKEERKTGICGDKRGKP